MPAKSARRGTISRDLARAVLPKESEIQKACLEWLNYQPKTKCWRRNVGGMKGIHNGKRWFMRFGQPGMSDIEGISSGLHVEIEIKRLGEVPTLAQEQWLSEMSNYGAIAFWCDSLEALIAKWNSIAVEEI